MFRRTYVSLAVARTLSREHPLGNPTGGPASGAKESFIADAFEAIFAAKDIASTVVTVATVVSYVGVGLTVVGAVTGNAKLTKIGGIMGVVGGIGVVAGGMAGGDSLATTMDNANATDLTPGVMGSESAPLGNTDRGLLASASTATPEVPSTTDASTISSGEGSNSLIGSSAKDQLASVNPSPNSAPLGGQPVAAPAPAPTVAQPAAPEAPLAQQSPAAVASQPIQQPLAPSTAPSVQAAGTTVQGAGTQVAGTQAAGAGITMDSLTNLLGNKGTTGNWMTVAGDLFKGYSAGKAQEEMQKKQWEREDGLLAARRYNMNLAGRLTA